MIRTHSLLATLLFTSAIHGQGMRFSYTMQGNVYDHATKDVQRNTVLMIGKHIVTTDSTGWYSVVISGVTCADGYTPRENDRCNEAQFAQIKVRRILSDKSIIIRTNWKDHACLDRVVFTPPCYLARVDLFLP